MLIVCPSCATSYDIEPASLGADGRHVRCVRCRTVWRAELPHAAKLAAAAAGLAPDQPEPEVPIEAAATALAGAAADAHGIDASPQAQADDRTPDAPTETAADGDHSKSASTAGASDRPGGAIEVEAPSIAPADLDAGRPPVEIDAGLGVIDERPHASDVETLAARRVRRDVKRRRQFWSLSRLHTSILILLIVDCVLVGWRKDVVRLLPQTASLYAVMGLGVNLRGLSFADVTTSTETREGVPVLVVQGNVVNDSGTAIGVPQLKLVVRNAAKQEIYSWSTAPPLARLAPHQAVGFRTRLASPPPEASDVLVRFLNRRDSIADVR